MSRFFKVKNFERFQHYKDRSPPWIKLYNELLDDYEFGCLQDASKAHLIAIWLLASRSDNRLPYDPAWLAKRINATGTVDLDALRDAGFILEIQDDAASSQDASKVLAKGLPRDRGRDREEQVPRGESLSELVRHGKAIVRRVDVSPSDPILQRPDDPLACYSEAELKGLIFEFDGVDVESAICDLSRWCDRKGVRDPIERKNMIYGGLKKRHGKAKLVDAMESPQAVTVSPQLMQSKMMKKPPPSAGEIPEFLRRTA